MSPLAHLVCQLDKPHLIQSDINPLIQALEKDQRVDVKVIGHSFEQRPIHLLSLGQGPISIFAWTQMHGNEATATAAVFDIIDILLTTESNSSAEQSEPSLSTWQNTFRIHILPMLNPDGAQRKIRQNAQGIDINRDALSLQSPEGRLLMQQVAILKPQIGFNLHDQSPYYQSGLSGNPATIAFLAPAYDESKTIDKARRFAMQLIAHMNDHLQEQIPECIARYDDTYSHRSFGDCIAAQQVSTILIESGSARQDPNRQIARKMNVSAFLSCLEYIILEGLVSSKEAETEYFSIPENRAESMSSLLIKDLNFGGQLPYQAGISIKQNGRYSDYFYVEFVGDLGYQAGLLEYDGSKQSYLRGKVFKVEESFVLSDAKYYELLKQGYIQFDDEEDLLIIETDLPVWHEFEALGEDHALVLNQPAYFLLQQDSQIQAAVLNGKIVQLI